MPEPESSPPLIRGSVKQEVKSELAPLDDEDDDFRASFEEELTREAEQKYGRGKRRRQESVGDAGGSISRSSPVAGSKNAVPFVHPDPRKRRRMNDLPTSSSVVRTEHGRGSANLDDRRKAARKRKRLGSTIKPLYQLLQITFDPAAGSTSASDDVDADSTSDSDPSEASHLHSFAVTDDRRLSTKREDDESSEESEEELAFRWKEKRQARQTSARVAPEASNVNEDCLKSESEPESEPELPHFRSKGPSHTQPASTSTFTVRTEPTPLRHEESSESPEELRQSTMRPAFELADASQACIGPLVLDTDASDPSKLPISVPASINRFLREYQREGIRFFYERYARGLGGLLGDDMGLGKTIEVIGFLSAIMRKHGWVTDEQRRIGIARREAMEWELDQDGLVGRKERKGRPRANERWPTALIVAPSTVKDNWARELETWGYFEYAIYSGEPDVLKQFKLARLDILICSFETARNYMDELFDLDLSVVVVDEVHRLKNPNAAITRALNRLQCKRRFGLTGTAVQNRYEELWCILDWCNPRKVGTIGEWKELISEPLKKGQKKDASEEELALGRERAEQLVRYLLPHFFLRRTKNLIADQLPKKEDKVVFCPLTQLQTDVYKRLLETEHVQLMTRKDEPCDCGRTDSEGLQYKRSKCCYQRDPVTGMFWYEMIFKFINIFQRISNHLALIYPDKADPNRERYERDCELVKIAFPNDHETRRFRQSNAMEPDLCGKWNVLKELLQVWKHDGSKVLIFSMSVKLISFLEWYIQSAGHEYCRLDGNVPQGRRMELIDRFNNNPQVFIFLISTLTGGVGLNLTGANKVVIMDPNWNPSHDLQAMDRAYRFGQTRDVQVLRLIGAGSLEECVYGRQIYKQQQSNIAYDASHERRYWTGVEGDKDNQGELFGVRNIFRLQEHGLATKYVIDDCNIAELGYALENLVKDKKREKRKGRSEEDGGEDEINGDEALAELVHDPELIRKSLRERDSNPIDWLLQDCAIEYAHSNAAVVGETVTERKIGERARKSLRTRKKSRASSAVRSTSQWPPPPGSGAAIPHEGNEGLVDEVAVEMSQEDPSILSKEDMYAYIAHLTMSGGLSALEIAEYYRTLDEKGHEKFLSEAIKWADRVRRSKAALLSRSGQDRGPGSGSSDQRRVRRTDVL